MSLNKSRILKHSLGRNDRVQSWSHRKTKTDQTIPKCRGDEAIKRRQRQLLKPLDLQTRRRFTKDKDLFPTFANFLLDELHTFFLCSEGADKNELPRELLENEKKYAWTFTNNFIMEYRDEFAFDVTSLCNFAIAYIRIACSKSEKPRRNTGKNLQRVRDYMKRAKLGQTREAETNAIPV